MFKSESQHLYHIQWSLLGELSWKKSFLLKWKILGQLVNTLASDEMYPVLNRDNLMILFQMQLSQKKKTFSEFFAAFFKSRLNFEHLKKKMTLTTFAFPKLRTLKTWLDKYLKSPVSENLSTSNMPKHCWNLDHSTFIRFIGHWQGNSARKSHLYWHAKSWDFLLAHWVPTKCILFLIETI